MASFCLPKEFANKFIEALKSGKIDPAKLIEMTSAERRKFLEPIVGEANVREVNALLESKLLLKDQKRGLVSWAKSISGITEKTRTDLLSKIERLDEILSAADEQSFLEDLAAKRLGTEITREEAKNIVEASKEVRAAKDALPANDPIGSEARMDYGLKYTLFQKYVSELKSRATELTWREWLSSPNEWFNSIAGSTKSILSSLDNSFFGRQGIKTLYTQPDIWAKNFIKSFGDIKRELVRTKKDVDPVDIIKADIYSRPNAVNGKYETMSLDIGIASEEAFPSPLPGKIPVLGRAFKGAETAFNGGALRMRADLADRLIPRAEKAGVNMSNKEEAQNVGQLINSLTGRGDIGRLNVIGKEINNAIFSIKFLKSNFDVLFKGVGSPIMMAADRAFGTQRSPGEIFARREAAKNLLKITVSVAGILSIANMLYPGSVDFDPRSPNFGKIKIGKHTIDITGGMGSVATLAMRLMPTYHNGKLGFWYKSRAGKWTQLNDAKYGQQTAVDVLENFGEGKLSPVAGVARDVWQGRDYDGNKIGPNLASAGRLGLGLITPLPIQTFLSLNEPGAGATLGLMILDGLGLTVNTQNK